MFERTWQYVRPYGRWMYYGMFPGRRPPYFDACWRHPFYRIGRDLLPRPPSRTLGHRAFLFFPLVDWHSRMQRPQHLARALADRGHLCIYVNPHLGLEYGTPRLFSSEARLSTLAPGIFELHVHLPAEHPIDSRLLVRTEAELILKAIGQVVRELPVSDAIQIVNLPSWLDVVTGLRERCGFPILYDCHDHLAGFRRLSDNIVKAEPELLEACDRAVFSSDRLLKIASANTPGLGAKATIVRNACCPEDFSLLSKAKQARGAGTVAYAGTVGYVGSLDHWFDVELVAETARANPTLQFMLTGRVEDARIKSLERWKNVYFTGEVAYSSIPRLLHGCDAAMIPFARTPLTLATNPIKLYEYFCAGLPVVSTRLPEVELYDDLVYIADTSKEFATLVSEAVREGQSARRQRRLAVARTETWGHRANTLVRLSESV
jgi:glycosyltransferase involved in cell wall biosynthesis